MPAELTIAEAADRNGRRPGSPQPAQQLAAELAEPCLLVGIEHLQRRRHGRAPSELYRSRARATLARQHQRNAAPVTSGLSPDEPLVDETIDEADAA